MPMGLWGVGSLGKKGREGALKHYTWPAFAHSIVYISYS